LVSVTAGEVRQLGLGIVAYEQDGNPNHAAIVGKKTKSTKRKLSKLSVWRVKP
jgi:hypothetical protein